MPQPLSATLIRTRSVLGRSAAERTTSGDSTIALAAFEIRFVTTLLRSISEIRTSGSAGGSTACRRVPSGSIARRSDSCRRQH